MAAGVVKISVVKAHRNLADVKDPKDFRLLINTPRLETVPDHWTSQILAYSSITM